ncbi:hypothetical protein E3N88_06998 [Mikania micrantha]|uniref:Uncharacterized protein n=1 Tax=Mikania micrantha TaxID=192012 RepID=A0A5N6PRC4_9ASTR|nr:hypothetical protein E3N88_06998 [Mikania micrantha]
MANLGERYIYQRFPYVILDDTPCSSSGSDSAPSEASSGASQVIPVVPHTPSSPVPVTPPPVPSGSHGHSQQHAENASAGRRQSSSPQRVPGWDGLRRMRGQDRKTIGLPPRHQMASRDEALPETRQGRKRGRKKWAKCSVKGSGGRVVVVKVGEKIRKPSNEGACMGLDLDYRTKDIR